MRVGQELDNDSGVAGRGRSVAHPLVLCRLAAIVVCVRALPLTISHRHFRQVWFLFPESTALSLVMDPPKSLPLQAAEAAVQW